VIILVGQERISAAGGGRKRIGHDKEKAND
jgi:hypothetical protein